MSTYRLGDSRTLARITSHAPPRLTFPALPARLMGAALLLLAPLVAFAAEMKVLSAGALKAPLVELVAQFERATGHKVTIVYGTAGTVRRSSAIA